MAANLATLAAATTAATALSNLILVSPQSTVGFQPQNPPNSDGSPSTAPQPPPLLFHYEGENQVSLESDITNHWAEDNTTRQDQIALKPETYTVKGFIGELNDVAPVFLQPVRAISEKLGSVAAYTPGLSVTALLAYQQAFFLYQVGASVANSAVAAWNAGFNALSGDNGQSVIGSNGLTRASAQNKQQQMFQQLYGYWSSRTLFTVQTPWAVFQNMALKSVRSIQEEATDKITDWELTFQMIRYAQTSLTAGGGLAAQLSGRAGSQSSANKDFGASAPPASQSLASGLGSMF